MAGCNWAGISRCPAETGPQRASWFSLKELALCRRVGGRKRENTNPWRKLPVELEKKKKKNVHPLSRGCGYIYLERRQGRLESWKKLRRERSRRRSFWPARGERVASAGDRSSLVAGLAWQKRITALPYYIHSATGNFLSPVCLGDPLPPLVLLPPTTDRLYEDRLPATILHIPLPPLHPSPVLEYLFQPYFFWGACLGSVLFFFFLQAVPWFTFTRWQISTDCTNCV